jgi:hypothetical protein
LRGSGVVDDGPEFNVNGIAEMGDPRNIEKKV